MENNIEQSKKIEQIEAKQKELEQEIEKIKLRNKRVETDKTWETSLARKIVITVLTYTAIVIFFYFAKLPRPLINAIVPTAGFVLSTLSFPYFRRWWVSMSRGKK